MKRSISTIIIALCYFVGSSQDVPNYTPITPNAASLAKYGAYTVNKNTGVPNISILLYEIKQGDLSVPITLQYHASGIRVNEIGSWVGLGWNLSAGGAITRKVNGIPDEFAPNNGDILNKIGVIPNLDTLEFNTLFYNYFFDVIQGASDTSPDEYYYNFGHFTGKYIKSPEGFLFNKYEPLRINTADEAITITTDNGSNYLFEEEGFETTKIFPHLTCNISKSNPTYQELHDTEISSKKLTKIINSNAIDTIHFNYRDNAYQPTSYLSGQSIVYSFAEEVRTNDSYTPIVTLTEKILEEIVFKSGKIVFESVTDREDSGSSRLNCIYIYNTNNQLIDKIKFNYGYFDRSTGYGKSCQYLEDYSIDKSLKLESFEQGIVNPKTHTFTYNDTPLSIRGSNAQDYWGYSNANTNTSFIPEQTVTLYAQGNPEVSGSVTAIEKTIGAGTKEADEERMKAATLIRIDYPTGGYTEFEYEPNYYETVEQVPITQSFSESITAVGYTGDPNNDYCSPNSGLKVTKSFLPGPTAFDANIRIHLSDASAERSAAVSSYVNIEGMYLELPEVLKTTHLRPSSIGLDYYPSYDFSSNVLFGSGYSNNFYNGVTIEAQEFGEGFAYRASSCPYASITVSWKEIIGFEEKTVKKYTGGLRIKSISGFTSDTNLATKKIYNYKRLHEILAVNKDTRIRHSTTITPITLSTTISSSEIVNSSVDMGASTEYLEVEEVQIDEQGNQNGKIITYYHATPVIRNLDNRWTNFGYRAHDNLDSRCHPYQTLLLAMQGPLNWTDFKISTWSSGLLRKEETYKYTPTDTLLVSKTENSYEMLIETEIPVNRVLTIGNLELFDENDWELCSNNSSTFIYAQGFFSLGKKALRSSTQTQYDLNGENPVVTIENYQYDNSHFLRTETETTDSQSNIIKTKTYYPDDIADTSSLPGKILSTNEMDAIDQLKSDNQHRINTPIQIETYKNDKLLSRQRTNYKNWGTNPQGTSNIIAPKNIETAKAEEELESRILYHAYDQHANPQEVSESEGHHIYYIWGYNKANPIAKIENFKSDQITPETQLLIDAIISASDADTDNCTDPSCKEQQLRVALSNLQTSLALQASQMTYYTYDPLIGVTSITDPRGQTTYYHYDEFNRLEAVTDANGNLLSENEYNYKQ